MSKKPLYIDNLQYANWSPALFDEMAQAHLAAVHVTICYHENFRQTVENMISWNRYIEAHPDRLMFGRTGGCSHRPCKRAYRNFLWFPELRTYGR